MKKLISPILITILGLSLFSSCAKKSSSPSNNSNNSNTPALSAMLGGVNWTANSIVGDSTYSGITVTGTRSDGTYIQLFFPTVISGGTTYSAAGSTGTARVIYYDGASIYLSTSGSIVLSYYSNEIVKGTFNCVVYSSSTIDITSGTFTAKIK